MTPHADFAREIVDFLEQYGLDCQIAREIVFVVATDNQPAAEGLVEIIRTRGFQCEIEPDEGNFWMVNARIVCIPLIEQLEHICQRFLAATEEFDCEVDGFRVQAEELVATDRGRLEAAFGTADSHDLNSSSLKIGPIIQELMEMGISEEELFDEIGAISRVCPAITRITRTHQALELYRGGHYAGACEMFQQLCDETPTEQRSLLPLMARCKQQLEQFDSAAMLYEHALALRDGTDPDDAAERLELTVQFGTCLAQLGRFEKEVELYTRVLCENPRHASAHYQMARQSSRRGDLDLSLMHLREAIVSNPTLMQHALDDQDLVDVRRTSEYRAYFG